MCQLINTKKKSLYIYIHHLTCYSEIYIWVFVEVYKILFESLFHLVIEFLKLYTFVTFFR